MSRYTEIIGCLHIHFPIKSGKKGFELLGMAGEKAGVDFLIINTHTPEKNPEKYETHFKFEGYYGKTLIINGEEVHGKDKKNHCLIIGGDKWFGRKDRDIEDVFPEVLNKGCLTFIAHPYGNHRLFMIKKEYKWEKWDIDGFTGIEVWSLLFDWAESTNPFNLFFRYFGFPDNLKGPEGKVLKMWDTLLKRRKTVGICGLDIHGLPFLFRLLDIKKNFSYHNIFKILRNHLFIEGNLTGDFDIDKRKIIEALKKGRLYFANDRVAESNGFYFGEEDGRFIMGEAGRLGSTLLIKNPKKAKTRFIGNGKIIWEKEIISEKVKPEVAGNYRVEVYLNGKNWIFSNPVYLE
ncbi:hypothetical protein J7L87_05400 [bacterium]|nr:hypothetical protein [bacterium]